MFILPPAEFDPEPGYPEAQAVIDSVVTALTAARPTKVLCLSTIGADAVHDNLLSQRTMMEAALRELSLPLTILRPAWFIDNAAWDVASARETGLIHSFLQPTDKAFPMVAAKDVGRVAADLIQEDWTGIRVVELEGPCRVTPNDLADAFASAIGKPVRAVPVPREYLGSTVPLAGHEEPRTPHADARRLQRRLDRVPGQRTQGDQRPDQRRRRNRGSRRRREASKRNDAMGHNRTPFE